MTIGSNSHQGSGPMGPLNSPPLMMRNRRAQAGVLSHSTSHTFLSANEHISNLLMSKQMSESLSDMSVSSLDTPSSQRRNRTTSTNLTDVDSSSIEILGRSSSTLSLVSNPGQGPLDSVLKHLRQRLCGQIFSGWYRERRYVDAIERYRDLIVVDAGESVVIRQVRYAIKKSAKILGDNVFIGLSIGDDESRIFTDLGCEGPSATIAQYPFGHFWFQIRHIAFVNNIGFILDLFVIRPFLKTDSETCWKCKERELAAVKEPPPKIDSLGAAFADMQSRLGGVASDAVKEYWRPSELWRLLRPLLTKENAVNLVKLCSVLVMAAFAALLSGLHYSCQILLKALHELAFIVDRSTPLALGALNIFSKIVGGFYLLLAMIWRDSTKPAPPRTAMVGAIAPPSRRDLLALSSAPPPAAPIRPVDQRPSSSTPATAMDNMFSSHRNW